MVKKRKNDTRIDPFSTFVETSNLDALLESASVGQQITMNISTGHGRDMVYSEPQAMIFHREQYGQDFQRQVGESAEALKVEIKNISDGIVSERMRRSIISDAALDVEGMDLDTLVERFGSKQKALDIRTTARNLQQHLSSGTVRVNEIPELANELLKQAQREAFRKGNFNGIDIVMILKNEKYYDQSKCFLMVNEVFNDLMKR